MSQGDNQNDLEQVRQIERNIAQLLNHGAPAEVDKGTIENGYSILDASAGEIPGTLHEKCAAIVRVLRDEYDLHAEYSVLDGTVRFVPSRE